MKLKITVHGVAYEVDVEVLDAGEGFPAVAAPSKPRAAAAPQAPSSGAAPIPKGMPIVTNGDGGSVTSPIAGTVLEIKVKPGDHVEKNQTIMIIEAMKMKTSIAAPTAGEIKAVSVAVGDAVRESQTLVEYA